LRIAVYTSFAVNYLAKARVLFDSIHEISPEIDVFGILADRLPSGHDPASEPFKALWLVEDYGVGNDLGWIFRHSIMELATAPKGWALVRLLEMGYDYVIYLDPDCWVLGDLRELPNLLEPSASVGIVPHTMFPAKTATEIHLIEMSSLRHGIFNLGFLIVKNDENGNLLANWWADRLHEYCIDDCEKGLFTDQRWFDLAVGYFDFIQIIRHNGIDVASWNIGQRTLVKTNGKYFVNGDPLIFYHFSGVGPAGVHRWVRDIFAPADPVAAELEFRYEALINARGQAELSQVQPFFDHYSDGQIIPRAHRTRFRLAPHLQEAFANPFDVSAPNNARFELTRKDDPQMKIMRSKLRDDVDAAALLLFDEVAFDLTVPDQERCREMEGICAVRLGTAGFRQSVLRRKILYEVRQPRS
jgi:hypothetical protein